jgi:three-Cys-motif partner protein
MSQQRLFGGSWTQEKLVCLEKYLRAYTQIFHSNEKARFFKTVYVDAFAGTGALNLPDVAAAHLFPELDGDAEEYKKGSALRALEVEDTLMNRVSI